MKIAIYGDSFGVIHTVWETKMQNDPRGSSWPESLQLNHTVDNYAKSGSAFMYSYELFLKHNSNYDLNIFVVTNPQRTYIKALDDLLIFGGEWVRHELKRISKLSWYEKKDDHLEILKSVEVYLDKWKDWEMDTHVQHVLVNNLWILNPNTLVIPAFNDSMQQTTKNLFDLAKYELKLVDEEKFNNFNFGFLDCNRKCHFSEENNIVIYNTIVKSIENKQKILTLEYEDIQKPSRTFDEYVASNKHNFI
jgi:hypothetical protein